MMDLAKKPRSPCLRLLASGESAKNAADHLGERAGIWPGCIDVESAEPDTFSILNASPPARDRSPCVLLQGRVRFGGFPGRGKTVANSACHHRAAPGWRHSLRLILVFGPEFLAATLDNPPAWLDAASRQEMAARLQSEIAERERRLADLRRP